jgi:histidine triad (HIT) family protein
MTDCIFCKIIAKQIPADVVYEDNKILVFKDIHPKARIHLLMIPKEHIKNLAEFKTDHSEQMLHMLFMLPKLAKDQGLINGFRTVINTGVEGGQIVDHIHFHLLGGNTLPKL